MTTTEHLQAIKAECERLLAVAEKRTTGEWTLNTHSSPPQNCNAIIAETGIRICEGLYWNPNGENDGEYITACPNNAEAGWKSTIRYIDHLADLIATHEEPYYGAAIYESNKLCEAWPIDLLTNNRP